MVFLLLGACATAALNVGDPDEGRGAGEDSGSTTSAERCEDIPALPAAGEPLPGLVGAEDFAFDGDGNVLFINESHDLVAQTRSGEVRVIAPGVASFTAGTRLLPDGKHVMVCDVGLGSLLKIDVDSGDVEVVLGGLEYPNGLEVDAEGYVYVSEETAGVVRRVDPGTGDYEVIAEHLYRPNGLRYRASDATLFIGSFGAGVVWAVTRNGAGDWSAPRVAATTPLAPGQPCADAAVGDACGVPGVGSLGACADDGRGGLTCGSFADVEACDGLTGGDVCTTTRLGEPVTSRCTEGSDTVDSFCPASDGERVAACAALRPGTACEVYGEAGTCTWSWQGVPLCYDVTGGTLADMREGCVGKAEYEACVSDSDLAPHLGQCVQYSSYDGDGLACTPLGISAKGDARGGLDGLNLDECGNLYVTELSPSTVWRFVEEGAEAEVVYADGEGGWIPNLHFGNGLGGWEADVLYASERIRGMLIALKVGVRGEEEGYSGGD